MAIVKLIFDTESEEFIKRLAAVMEFAQSSGAVKLSEPVKFEEHPEYVDPVLATEAEEVRNTLRPLLQDYAKKHGVKLAQQLMQECGASGIKTANAEALAQLRHYFAKYQGGKSDGGTGTQPNRAE